MGLLIKDTDFVGRYEIAVNNFNRPKLNDYIDNYEQPFLQDLLGDPLFQLFKVDINNYVPVAPIYTAIYNAFNVQINNCTVKSFGLKKVVLGIVYFNFLREDFSKSTQAGMQKVQDETSEKIQFDWSTIQNRYNDSIWNAEAIQKYLADKKKNTADYQTYDGREFCKRYGPQHWSL